MFVPVVDQNQKPLMPTTCSRARKWIRSKKATPFWKKGIFCVRLNVLPSDNKKQEIAVGIDPGSKREAYTIKSTAHTYVNILTETPDWVKDAVERRRNARRSRRQRKTPCRKNRSNRTKISFLAPSTKSRWQLKLRICSWLIKMFPVDCFIVEDIKAESKKFQKKWNRSFSPLEVGKNWFYQEIEKLGALIIKKSYETKELRDQLELKKSSSKLADKFECHNVDSWVLSWDKVGGSEIPENKEILKIIPLQFHRRQLHVFQFAKNGIRKQYGSTRSLGFKRGSLVKHKKHGLCYVGGSSKGRISLHEISTGKRICKDSRIEDCKFKTYLSWR